MAQGPVELRGRVVDAETGQPVSNAQIGVAGNRLGTSTNSDGVFMLSIQAAYQHGSLEVALLGYRNYAQVLLPLPGPGLLIRLQISPAALGEVTITSSMTGITREAVVHIPRNYPVCSARLTGFYREAERALGDSSQYQYFAEGLLTVFKAGYQHPGDDGAVEIREPRKVELLAFGTANHSWYGGPSCRTSSILCTAVRPSSIRPTSATTTTGCCRKPRFGAGRCTPLLSPPSRTGPRGSVLQVSYSLRKIATPFCGPSGTARRPLVSQECLAPYPGPSTAGQQNAYQRAG